MNNALAKASNLFLIIFFTVCAGLSWADDLHVDSCQKKLTLRIEESKKFIQDLDWRSLPKSGDESYFSEFTESNTPHNYLSSNLKNILIANPSDCSANVVAYVTPASNDIHFCPVDSNSCVLPSVFDVSTTLIHEARHIENPKTGHRQCVDGIFWMKNGCDLNRLSRGSYHFETDFIIGLAQNTKLSSPLRRAAAAVGLLSLLNRFVELPEIKTEKVIFLRSTGGQFYLLDQSGAIKPLPANIKNMFETKKMNARENKKLNPLYSSQFGQIFFFDNITKQFVYNGNEAQRLYQIPALANKYNMFSSAEDVVVDYLITKTANGKNEFMLFNDRIWVWQQWRRWDALLSEVDYLKNTNVFAFESGTEFVRLLPGDWCQQDRSDVILQDKVGDFYLLEQFDRNQFNRKKINCDKRFLQIKSRENLGSHLVELLNNGQLLVDGKNISGKNRFDFISESMDILNFLSDQVLSSVLENFISGEQK